MATNGLLTEEILSFFEDMFAGRGIEPVPTPAEFAARRLRPLDVGLVLLIPAVQFGFRFIRLREIGTYDLRDRRTLHRNQGHSLRRCLPGRLHSSQER